MHPSIATEAPARQIPPRSCRPGRVRPRVRRGSTKAQPSGGRCSTVPLVSPPPRRCSLELVALGPGPWSAPTGARRAYEIVAPGRDRSGRLAQPGESSWLTTSRSGVRVPQRPLPGPTRTTSFSGRSGAPGGLAALRLPVSRPPRWTGTHRQSRIACFSVGLPSPASESEGVRHGAHRRIGGVTDQRQAEDLLGCLQQRVVIEQLSRLRTGLRCRRSRVLASR
jgi:hypothetical protein